MWNRITAAALGSSDPGHSVHASELKSGLGCLRVSTLCLSMPRAEEELWAERCCRSVPALDVKRAQKMKS